MIRLINISRYTIIVSVLLVFILFSPIAAAKHIIVIYDVSKSMISLKVEGHVNTYMESKDISRVNEYLTNLLFTNTAQSLRHNNDTIIKECDAAYAGKPLYQSGDILTYAEYAKQRKTKLNREQVSKNEFQQKLPNPMPLNRSFYGMVSYLQHAEAEVYDELYNDTDDETYWVFVTDGDIDNSGKSGPGTDNVLKRLAQIEKDYFAPMIFGVFVNKHVMIKVRKLQKRDEINSIFFATPTKPGKLVQEIQLERDNEGKFISETLTIETHNSDKSRFNLNSVNVEIVDKFNKPIQRETEENISGVIEVPPVLLNGNPPPYAFRIPFPGHSELSAPDNALKLEVTYSFNGGNKIYSPQPLPYTAIIDNIYVSIQGMPKQQAKELDLNFSEDTYHANLVIQSESHNKQAFKIDKVTCHVQYKDERKLIDVAVPKVVERLGEPFTIKVPKHDHLEWHGSKVVLDIDYKYDDETKSETIGILLNPIDGGSGLPMWLIWVFLVPVLGIFLFLFIYGAIKAVKPKPVEHRITLTIGDAIDGLVPNNKEPFTLTDKNSLAFRENNEHELHFDVGWFDCPDFLRCEPSSPLPWSRDKGRIRHYKSIDDTEGKVVNPPEILTLKWDENNIEVRIQYDKEDNTSDTNSDDESFKGSTEHVDPLKV